MNTTKPTDTWRSGDPYERYVGRWSRQVAPRFLAWLALPPAGRWLDVGCGTGALSAAILESCAPVSVVGIDPSAGFLATASARLGERVQLHQAPAAAIPLTDAAVDATVSALVLNFVPDTPDAAARARLRERIRSRIHFDADGAASLQARAWAVRGRVVAP